MSRTIIATSNCRALLSQKTTELAAKAKARNDLAKAAKEVGATVKTSDLVGQTGQVPELGAVGQVAPQLFDMTPGAISGPINAGRTGVVAKLVDKEEPSMRTISRRTSTRRGIRFWTNAEARLSRIFANNIISDYKKHNRVRMNAKHTVAGRITLAQFKGR